MNFSRIFIRRPIGTALLAIGLFLVGAVAYAFLPVASLPSIDLATISVSASRPGADPNTMAATVAAPLERRLGEISGVTEITSVSSLGSSRITVQFDLSRNIDGAARDVQAALNAALSDLPSDMPTLPSFRKFNPAASPILILALTSKTMQPSAIYDAADSVIAQRLSPGGRRRRRHRRRLRAAGAARARRSDPARRHGRRAWRTCARRSPMPTRSARSAPSTATAAMSPSAPTISWTSREDYNSVVVKTVNGTVIRLTDIATARPGVRNSRAAGWFNKDPSVLLIITKQGNANVLDTIDRIYELLPQLKQWVPAGLDISVLADRTQTIRASVRDMQLTLAATVVLVMLVVFLFLRRAAATAAAGITVPLALAGTCAAMWVVGFSIDNLSLMALAVCVGFVVDDAIVMIENVFSNLERGYSPLRATLMGARQIGFTVISISVSLIAAFIPLLLMGGIVGRLFREFSVTLAFAIAVSTVVSLSVTPMICAYFVRRPPSRDATWLDRAMDGMVSRMLRFYDRSLSIVLEHRALTLVVFIATIALTVGLYIRTPKGYFPQDDTGLIFGGTEASPDISFDAMKALQLKAMDVVLADPAVKGLGSSVGASYFNASVNHGRMFISLKPLSERHNVSTQRVVARLRARLNHIPGIRVFMVPAQDLRVGGRQSSAQYQFTLWSSDIDTLQTWVPRVLDRVKQVPGIVDVTTDRDQGGLQANIDIDRPAAARFGVRIQDIDSALNDAFSQRQISTIYGTRNQYRVILEVDQKNQRDPNDLSQHLRLRPRRHRGAAIGGGAGDARHRAAGGEPSGPVSLHHHHLQSGARHHARGRHRRDRAGGGRTARPRHDPQPTSPATSKPFSRPPACRACC